jgi:3-dehydroquinate synthase
MEEYPIHIGGQALSQMAQDLAEARYSILLVLADENTYRDCYPRIQGILPKHTVFKIKPGEEYKTIDTCNRIWEILTELMFDRHSAVINLGGGVIGDMGGFAAATFKRGIDFFQVPTSLLAMVDASVGGKLGIDFHAFKNQVGLFGNPKAVYVDPEFLKTLPDRELRAGFSEVVKHHLIADKEGWEALREKRLEELDFDEVIRHSIAIKSRIVGEDPRESDTRKSLNFGHTIGHALESYFIELFDEQLLHGEAVAIGMICEAHVSFQRGMLSKAELDGITRYIMGFCRKAELPHFAYHDFWEIMKQDKKNIGGNIRCTLLNGIGNFAINQDLGEADAEAAMDYYMEQLSLMPQ